MTIGTRLQERRVALGLTQAHVAEAAGIAQPSLSAIEAGRNHPSYPVLQRLCGVLRLRLDLTPEAAPEAGAGEEAA